MAITSINYFTLNIECLYRMINLVGNWRFDYRKFSMNSFKEPMINGWSWADADFESFWAHYDLVQNWIKISTESRETVLSLRLQKNESNTTPTNSSLNEVGPILF